MRHLGRRLAPSLTEGLAWLRLAAMVAALLGAAAAQARGVSIRGIAEKGFGRIELTFDQATKVQVRNNGAILVLAFSEPVKVRSEKLAGELPGYVSTSRRDPDGTGIRLALTRAFRVNQLEAGERVYIDLLPERWSGLPPGLPPEVVAELAERARIAEERLKAGGLRGADAPRPVVLRLAQTPQQTRLVFEPPAGTRMRFEDRGGATELRLDGALTLDLGGNKPRTAEGIADFSFTQDPAGLAIRVEAKPGRTLRSAIDEGTALIDLIAPAPAAAPLAAAPEPAAAAPEPRETSQPAPAVPAPAAPAPAPRSAQAAGPAPVGDTADPIVAPPVALPAGPAATIRPLVTRKGEEPGLLLPFQRPTPAAAYERGGRTIVVFQTSDQIDLDLKADAAVAVGLRAVRRQGAFTILAFDAHPERSLRLLPQENAWRIALGGEAVPPDDVLVTRQSGQDGRGEVAVGIVGAGLHWILDPDDVPLAVVTTLGRQGLAHVRRFVEFQLPQTIQGAVVQPVADGVEVGLRRGGVVVTRKKGLSLSVADQVGAAADPHPFVIRADEWERDTSGDVVARYQTFVAVAAEAPRAGKAAVRFELARFLLANGMAHEAGGILAAASGDDPLFARRRETLLLSGIAAARAHRLKQARVFLSDEVLSTDPEAALWRASLDAAERDWPKAASALRRAEPVLGRYPDDLAGAFRLLLVRAAVALGDVATAEDALAAIERLPLGAVERDAVDLARARIDEAAGRATPALAAYERLANAPSRPIAAAAGLHLVQLGRKTARLQASEAIARLETLAVSWRGDEIELGSLGQLVRLYGETKRWRDMLTTARQAQSRFSTTDEARRIYDDAAAWFELIFLGEEGASIEAVDYLALYYDFKEFAPVGRRGDEIVRRIADRLVEIDLLDQAAALLQHQVDHRLTGIARATIATRLAALRLMSGKPALAIGVLQATRMAELPAPLRRLRLIMEAQGQADLARADLALEVVDGEEGADFARLRATILFGAGRWREAGEAFEGLLGTRWKDAGSLTEEERQDVVRALLADILAQEGMALDRVRSKFAAKMGDSPDARLFEALLRPRAAQSAEFRTALREASRPDTLRRFLGDWSRVSDLTAEEPASGKAARVDGKPGAG